MNNIRVNTCVGPRSHRARGERDFIVRRALLTKIADVVTRGSHSHFNYGLLFVLLSFFVSGCAVKKMALNSLANTLSEEGAGVYASDDDPELVADALPFALKTMEALLQSLPNHRKLLVATAAGFVQYTHAFVLQPVGYFESGNFGETRKRRERAKRLFIRARDYGLRALELQIPGFAELIQEDPVKAVFSFRKQDVPALYWTGVAWASAISVAKDDMDLVGELPLVQTLLEKALELDESWGEGAIHEFFIAFEAGRPESEGGGSAKAQAHFERAMKLNGGKSIGPMVMFAENVCVREQDRGRFKELLNQAIAFDLDQYPENRLANILAQRKAQQLLSNIDELFISGDEETGNGSDGARNALYEEPIQDKENVP